MNLQKAQAQFTFLKDLRFKVIDKIGKSDTTSYIRAIYDSTIHDYNIYFKNASPKQPIDTIGHYKKHSFIYQVYKMPPIVCDGVFSAEKAFGIVFRMSEKFRWAYEPEGKNVVVLKDRSMDFRELLLHNPYTVDFVPLYVVTIARMVKQIEN